LDAYAASKRANPNYGNEGRAAAAESRANYGNEGKGDSKYEKRSIDPKSQALQGVYPEEYLTPSAGIKTVAALAKGLANRGKLRTITQEALPAPTRKLGYDKADARAKQRTARAEGRNAEMAAENARNYGLDPKAPGYERGMREVRKNLGGDDFTLGMKRGGSVGSASRRADGIATKGKTKGRMC
jgi:hypothetical protein